MSLGSLRLTLPDWQVRDVAVDRAELTVGRDADNDLVIDDPSLSRRHARLMFQAGEMLVEDLGSSRGTFIGDQRLEANAPRPVPPGTAVRLGSVELAYQPPLSYQATESFRSGGQTTVARAEQSAPAHPPLRASLAGPSQPVAPGGAADAVLTIHNLGPDHDDLAIRLSGVPAAWVHFSQEQVSLPPNAQAQISLSFHPPLSPEAAGSEHRFTLTIFSRLHRTGVNVDGVLTVASFSALVLGLRPVRSPRDFQVEVINQGSAPVRLTFSGADADQALVYHFSEPVVTLPPGQSTSIGLSVTPKIAPRLGARHTRPFTIVAQSAASGAEPAARATGQLAVRPPLPMWLLPLGVVLSLCLCLAASFAYFRYCPDFAPGAPFCPAGVVPVINVLSVTPSEITAGSTVVLAWDVSNADRVELISPSVETLEPSGLRPFTLSTNTTFVLRAANPAGTVEAAVSVRVLGTGPTIEAFAAEPGVIVAGETSTITLSWTTVNANLVMIEGLPTAELAPSGAIEVPAPSANTTYTLVASNAEGEARQAVTIVVTAVDCAVTGLPAGDRLNLRAGPGGAFPVVAPLDNSTRVDPLARSHLGDWLQVRAAGRAGWLPANFVSCTDAAFLVALPTVAPALLPTLAATATSTPLPSTATLPPPPPTATPTPTPSPTPTPLFASGGVVTYRVQAGGRTSIFLQPASGDRIPLVFDQDDAEVLDYTPHHGGRFAIWVLAGGQQKVLIISLSGQLVGGPITGAWSAVVDADWSYDGQRLVVEAVTAGATNYHFYDAAGLALGQPALP